MKTITLLNEKGGVGKTTLATTLAAGYAALLGARVLIVDADAQGHSTLAFGLQKAPGFYDLLKRNAEWKDVLTVIDPAQYGPNKLSKGRLVLLPGNDETRHLANAISDATSLRRRLKQIERVFDIVIFDTSPTPSLLHSVITMATDHIVYPTKLETWSLDGLRESMGHVHGLNEYFEESALRGAVAPLGIVPNITELSTVEHAENMRLLNERFGDLMMHPISKRTLWREATSATMSIFAYAPESAEAEAGRIFVEEVHERSA